MKHFFLTQGFPLYLYKPSFACPLSTQRQSFVPLWGKYPFPSSFFPLSSPSSSSSCLTHDPCQSSVSPEQIHFLCAENLVGGWGVSWAHTFPFNKSVYINWTWWYTPLIPVGRIWVRNLVYTQPELHTEGKKEKEISNSSSKDVTFLSGLWEYQAQTHTQYIDTHEGKTPYI